MTKQSSEIDFSTPASANQFKTKLAIKKQLNQVNRLIYEWYNQTADEQDKISCGFERITKHRRIWACLTNQHRKERAQSGQNGICSFIISNDPLAVDQSGCKQSGKSDFNNPRLVRDRAKSQMKRIHYEITMMAQYNLDLYMLVKRATELKELYGSE